MSLRAAPDLLQSMSERLLGLATPAVSEGIEKCLGDLGMLARAERVYVFMLSDDRQTLDRAYEWCDEGVPGHDFSSFRGVPVTAFPWSMKQFLRGEIVYVRDSRSLPAEAEAERGACEALRIGAYVNLPLFVEGEMVGWLGFDTDRTPPGWGDDDLQLMETAGRMLVFTITRSKREDILRNEQALSRRLAALGSFAAGLGHEINNPLSFVQLNLELLRERIASRGGDEVALEQIADCRQGIERIGGTVNALRAFTRRASLERRPVHVGNELETTLRMLGPQISLRARIEREGDADAWVIAASSEIGQILTNVLQNAAQAIAPGQASEQSIEVHSEVDANWITLRVSDAGSGFREDVLPYVFDPFFTTRADGEGSGIGLALCHRIVTQLGGTIEASNRAAGGASIRIRLPVVSAPDQLRGGAAQPLVERRRILIVDDEPQLRKVIAAVLHEHEVVDAPDGRTAIKLLSGDTDFDLILCDVCMPDGTGGQVYQYVARETPQLRERFVFMSGAVGSEGLESSEEAEAVPRLAKPFTPSLLRAEVAKRAPLRQRARKT